MSNRDWACVHNVGAVRERALVFADVKCLFSGNVCNKDIFISEYSFWLSISDIDHFDSRWNQRQISTDRYRSN